MPSAQTRVGAIAAGYVLYLAAFFIFTSAPFTQPGYYWLSILVRAATAWLLFGTARNLTGRLRLAVLLLATSMLLDTAKLPLFQQEVYLPEWGNGQVPVWMPLFALYLFVWICGWGVLVADLAVTTRAKRQSAALALVVVIGFCALYVWSYSAAIEEAQQAQLVLSWNAETRFTAVFAAFGLLGLVLALNAILLGAARPFSIMASGFALMTAADFVTSEYQRTGRIADLMELDPLWMLGQCIVLAGAVMAASGPHALSKSEPKTKSELSYLLVIFTIGIVFVTGATTVLLIEARQWLWVSFAFVILGVAGLLGIVWVTGHFERAMKYARVWTRHLMSSNLEPRPWLQEADPGTRRTLRSTGLAALLEDLDARARELKRRVIFLGPESLNRPQVRARRPDEVSCFIVMPFGEAWSAALHKRIDAACRRHGVRPIRGDSVFTPTDIVDDIWLGINEASFIIADITGHNPNVMYELGIAHAIAKPVVILTQTADEIPIDLGTRRAIIYDLQAGGLDTSLDETLGALREEYAKAWGWEMEGD